MVDLTAEVAAVRETDDVYRVYRPEWVIVFSLVEPSYDSSDQTISLVGECREFFRRNYAGRVRPADMAVVVSPGSVRAGGHTTTIVRLQLRLPTLKAEFKTEPYARDFVTAQGWGDATIVARNSRGDHELRGYGRRLLGDPVDPAEGQS